MKTQLIGIALVSALLSGSGVALVQTPVWPRPDAPYLVYPYKIAGMEITDVKWLHLHAGDAMAQSVTLGVWLVDLNNSVNPATDFSPYADTQVRVMVHGVPVSDWLALPVSYTLQLNNPALESVSDGFHDVSLDVRGPRRDLFRPNPIELHLTRGRAFSPLVPLMNLDCEYCFYQDVSGSSAFGPGVAYVDWRTRQFRGYPVNPNVTPWHTDPAHGDLYQEEMAPHTNLFASIPMWWEEPADGPSAGAKFVRALQPKVVDDYIDNFRYNNWQWRGTNADQGFAGLRNLPYKDGPRGVAWTSPYISGMVDASGGFAFVEKGGPLRYMKPDGEVITVAGWRVKPDHDPVYFLKSFNQIRGAMELRGTWTNGQYSVAEDRGFHAPTDVTIDTRNERVWYVVGLDDNGVWKVVVDAATMSGTVSLLAGALDHRPGFADGPGTAARFNSPIGIAFNPVDRQLYVTDLLNDAIRKVDPDTGATSTVAGRPGQGVRVAQSGGQNCFLGDPVPGCFTSNEQTAAPARAASVFTVAAGSGQKADCYAPMGIRADSQGRLLVLDVGFASIREFDPVTGAVRLFAETGRRFDRGGSVGFFGLAVDRWGNSGPRDGVYWFQTVSGGAVDGEEDRHINELVAWVPPGGGKSLWLAGNDWAPCPDGWGPRVCSDLPHYPWMVAIDPRGAVFTSGMGEHGITRWRVRRPTDPVTSDWILYENGKKWWLQGTMNIVSGGASFALLHGWEGHNMLGFEDAWGHAADSDDQLLAAFDIPAAFSADPSRRAIVLNFLRLNAGPGGTTIPPAPPTPTPPAPTPPAPTSPGALDVTVTCQGLIAIGAPVRVTADGHTMTASTNPQGVASFAVTGTGPAVVSAGPTAGCGFGMLAIVRDGQGTSVTLALNSLAESCLAPFLPQPTVRYDESGALIVLPPRGCAGTVIR